MNRIYQIAMKNGSIKDAWIDVDEADYASAGLHDEYKRRVLHLHEWQGLTDEELKQINNKWNAENLWCDWNYERAIEAKLKEKNT